jgi:uncharacterized membrane protein
MNDNTVAATDNPNPMEPTISGNQAMDEIQDATVPPEYPIENATAKPKHTNAIIQPTNKNGWINFLYLIVVFFCTLIQDTNNKTAIAINVTQFIACNVSVVVKKKLHERNQMPEATHAKIAISFTDVFFSIPSLRTLTSSLIFFVNDLSFNICSSLILLLIVKPRIMFIIIYDTKTHTL